MAAVDELSERSSRSLALTAIAGRGFLARLTPDLIEELVRSSHAAWYPAGTVLAPSVEGIAPALILSGRLRYFLAAPDGRQLTLAYTMPGDIIGTVLKDHNSVSARFEVLQPTELLHLDEEHVKRLMARSTPLALAMLSETTERLRGAFTLLAGRAFMNVRVRVARDLWERAQMTECVREGQRLELTHQSLADATGSVREVVARTIRDLRHEGIVATDPTGITILDPEGLASAAHL